MELWMRDGKGSYILIIGKEPGILERYDESNEMELMGTADCF